VTRRPVITAIPRQDTSQPLDVLHRLKPRLDCRRRHVPLVDDKGNACWRWVGSATIWAEGPDEGRVTEQDVALHGEVMSGCDGNAVTKCTSEIIVQDGARERREANVRTTKVAEPRLGPNGYADSMQPS
jgi:hypothetical protein